MTPENASYFVLGGMFWIFAGDPLKYAGPLRFAMNCYVVACTIGLAVMLISKFTGVTETTRLFYGILLDTACGLAFGLSILYLSRQVNLSRN